MVTPSMSETYTLSMRRRAILFCVSIDKLSHCLNGSMIGSNLSKKDYDAEKLSKSKYLSTDKLDFLYTGEPNKDASLNYGLNYS